MDEFSELLSFYVKDRGFTNLQFARQCRIERTLLQKYLSGQRFPSNPEIYESICEQLRLSPDEKIKLDAAYEKKQLGPRYESFQMIENIIEAYGKVFGSDSFEYSVNADKYQDVDRLYKDNIGLKDGMQTAALFNRRDISSALIYLISENMQDASKHIYMLVQPGYNEIDLLLKGISFVAKCHVHQLVCLNPSEEAVIDNLAILKHVMSLTCSTMDYDVQYYYGNTKEHINSMSIMPNIILTGNMVLAFSYDMNRGFVSTDKEMNRVFMAVYDDMASKSRMLINKYKTVEDVLAFYSINKPADKGINYTPAVTYSFTKEFLASVIKPEVQVKAEVLLNAENLVKNWVAERSVRGQAAVTYFFMKEGVDYFMETGFVLEYPRALYDPLPEEMRLQVIEQNIEFLKKGILEGYLLKENGLNVGKGLWVNVHTGKCVCLVAVDVYGDQIMLEVNESGIMNTIGEYIDYLQTGTKAYDIEYTVHWLTERLQYWKDRYKNKS